MPEERLLTQPQPEGQCLPWAACHLFGLPRYASQRLVSRPRLGKQDQSRPQQRLGHYARLQDELLRYCKKSVLQAYTTVMMPVHIPSHTVAHNDCL